LNELAQITSEPEIAASLDVGKSVATFTAQKARKRTF
jgi:hypothetical protein